jgi:hypothetical protein
VQEPGQRRVSRLDPVQRRSDRLADRDPGPLAVLAEQAGPAAEPGRRGDLVEQGAALQPQPVSRPSSAQDSASASSASRARWAASAWASASSPGLGPAAARACSLACADDPAGPPGAGAAVAAAARSTAGTSVPGHWSRERR